MSENKKESAVGSRPGDKKGGLKPSQLAHRWSWFYLGLAVIALTVVMMLRSISTTDEIWVRSPFKHPVIGTRPFWIIESSIGSVAFHEMFTIDPFSFSSLTGRPTGNPFFRYEQSRPNGAVFGHRRHFSYLWLIGIEAFALFFLVPSVVTRTGRT